MSKLTKVSKVSKVSNFVIIRTEIIEIKTKHSASIFIALICFIEFLKLKLIKFIKFIKLVKFIELVKLIKYYYYYFQNHHSVSRIQILVRVFFIENQIQLRIGGNKFESFIYQFHKENYYYKTGVLWARYLRAKNGGELLLVSVLVSKEVYCDINCEVRNTKERILKKVKIFCFGSPYNYNYQNIYNVIESQKHCRHNPL